MWVREREKPNKAPAGARQHESSMECTNPSSGRDGAERAPVYAVRQSHTLSQDPVL